MILSASVLLSGKISHYRQFISDIKEKVCIWTTQETNFYQRGKFDMMRERLKQVRKYRNMNQKEFSAALGIAQSTIGMMEVGKREILDRHVKTICSVFNVNEEWFRYGKGSMIKNGNNVLQVMADEYRLDMFDIKLIDAFVNLKAEQRKSIINFVMSFAQKINAECLPEEIADYNSKRIYRVANTSETSGDYSESEIKNISDDRLNAIQSAEESDENL